jgi:mono/diheme cytochrome c family protein
MKLLMIACLTLLGASAYAADGKKSAAELEKEKALSNPYPNDFGPDHLTEEELKDYPADKKEGYKLMLNRCAQCHTPSRPLNSRFVEPDAGAVKPDQRDAKEAAALAEMKKEHGDWFKSPETWQIEAGIWNRYVKRMMNKPGCGVAAGGKMTNPEAKKIYEFLVYDGQRRKLGANAEKWKAHREKLVGELKTKKPARYEELKKDNDL